MFHNLLELIQERKAHTKFHMPGHKGRSFSTFQWEAWDTTELEGTDNLNDPSGPIQEMEETIAQIFGCLQSHIVVNGATCGLMAAILGSFQPGDSVIVPRSSHRSIYSGLYYGRLVPLYVRPRMGVEGRYPIGVDYEDLIRVMDAHPQAKGLILTNPTYYGTWDDLAPLVSQCKKRNLLLIVDEAHGAHFSFSSALPPGGLEAGGDIVVHSTHKTLSSLNQGALIHINSDRVEDYRIRRHLSMLQTSSPSYPILLSVAQSVEWMKENGSRQIDFALEMHHWTRQRLSGSVFPMVQDFWEVPTQGWDPMKLWFCSGSAASLGTALMENHRVDLEWEDGLTGLAMAGVGSIKEDYEELVCALKKEAERVAGKDRTTRKFCPPYPDWGERVRDPFQESQEIRIPLPESKGKIAAEFLIPYPPGMPLVCPGEVITEEMVEYLQKFGALSVLGVGADGCIRVYKEDR